jgi:hypothetical protein
VEVTVTFTFDTKAVAKRASANANPANPANSVPAEPAKPAEISGISSFSISKPPFPNDEYTPADLAEMDKLLRELAKLEGWSDHELADKLDQRRRMAPVNVLPVLEEIREAHKAALCVWPAKPAKHSDIRLCKLDHVELVVIDGGKAPESQSNPPESTKTPVPEPEAA